MRAFGLGLVLAALLPLVGLAQTREQTLADIRQELVVLNSTVLGLKRELSTTGGANTGLAGGTLLDRIDTIEAALAQVTAKTEALELRINQVVTDGTNRIGDLEFRLVELEGGDLGKIGQVPTLGGAAVGAVGAAPPLTGGSAATGAEMAVGEKADFDRAKGVLGQGDFRSAADLFATFAQTYTGGALTHEAHFLRGEALSQLGDTAGAARAWLDAFSGDPNGPRAPEALLELGQALAALGQGPEACVTLAEVGVRFPGGQPAADAAVAMQGFGCQ